MAPYVGGVEHTKKPQSTSCETLGSFFLEPEDIGSLSLGAIWNFSKGTGLH